MLFFQLVLFLGYAYAHLLSSRLSAAKQALLHIALLAAAMCTLPIVPSPSWKPSGDEMPVTYIFLLLSASVGLPYFTLASTGPLLQRWLSTLPGYGQDSGGPEDPVASRPVYRLYSLSNLGSLLALVSYPFVFEPSFPIRVQTMYWSWSFVAFGILCAICALQMKWHGRETRLGIIADTETAEPPTLGRRCLWLALATVPSVMLLAITNQVTADVAVVPFLWVFPLALYLLSFVLCFGSPRLYSRRAYAFATCVAVVAITMTLLLSTDPNNDPSLLPLLAVYFGSLFVCCMACHGELFRLKPHPAHLTSFYLTCAAGGALGGIFVGVIAPAVFPVYLELDIGILGWCLLMLVVQYRDEESVLYRGQPVWAWCGLGLGIVVLALFLKLRVDDAFKDSVTVSRNFYGVRRVKKLYENDRDRRQFRLLNGRIEHGFQFVDEKKRRTPTGYFSESSGAGLALKQLRPDGPIRVGAVGLGAGTIAAYGRPGDYFRFYEIDRDVIRIANTYFSYLSDSAAQIDVVLGDARLSLEREPCQKFDVLILDGFSGDAIPAHLLTMQAMETYLRHLNPSGIIAAHISNSYLDLAPLFSALAERFKLKGAIVQSYDDPSYESEWVVLSPNADAFTARQGTTQSVLPLVKRKILWTDENSNLFELLK